MKRLLLFTILLFVGVGFGQVVGSSYGDPLLERLASGPLVEEIRRDGRLTHTRKYDANGLWVFDEWHNAPYSRIVGTAVIQSVDRETGTLTFTGLIPEDMDVIWVVPEGSRQFDLGHVDAQDRSRFRLPSALLDARYQVGEAVRVGVSETSVTRYSYPPNRVIEERMWSDGVVYLTRIYAYDRNGLRTIWEDNHQLDLFEKLADFEYDENGNLIRELRLRRLLDDARILEHRYRYDELGRLTFFSFENNIYGDAFITYPQTTAAESRIELATPYSLTVVTRDHINNTLSFATTDHTRTNAITSYHFGTLLTALGVITPRHRDYPDLSRFTHGQITLDNQDRITQVVAYERPPSEQYAGAWWDIITTFDSTQELTRISLRIEPEDGRYWASRPPTTLTLTYSSPQ